MAIERGGGRSCRSARAVRGLAGGLVVAAWAATAMVAPGFAATTAPDPHASQRQWLEVSGDLAQHLRARDDPRQQLAAALLLSSPASRDLPADLEAIAAARHADAAAIFARARAGSDDPWILWLAVVGCPFEAAVCEAEAALQALQRIDGDNAAVWVVALHRARADGRRGDALAALQAMAASSRFDTYEGFGIRAWTDAFATLPSITTWRLASTMADEGGDPVHALSIEQERAVAALGGLSLAFAYNMPPIAGFSAACASEPASDLEWRQACRGAAQVMVDSEHLLARSLGLPVAFRFAAGDPDARAGLEALRREQSWIIESFSTLALDGFDADGRPDPGEAETLLAAWRDRTSELAMYRDLLRMHGLPLEPPAGYRVPGGTLAERETEPLARRPASAGRSR